MTLHITESCGVLCVASRKKRSGSDSVAIHHSAEGFCAGVADDDAGHGVPCRDDTIFEAYSFCCLPVDIKGEFFGDTEYSISDSSCGDCCSASVGG